MFIASLMRKFEVSLKLDKKKDSIFSIAKRGGPF